LRTPGRSLDTTTRDYFETRFGYDFGAVRIRADARAARSARDMGALAYTAGNEITFAGGQYAPHTAQGRHLLAHELAHVVQTGGAAPRTLTPSWQADTWERQAQRAATAVSAGQPYTVSGSAPPALRMTPDPRLQGFLDRIRNMSGTGVLTDAGLADQLVSEMSDLDLTNQDNLRPVMTAISSRFPHSILIPFLERVEARTQRREPTAADLQRIQNFPGRVRRRGPYGQYGPGVVLPVLANVVRPLYNIIQSLIQYFRGVLLGLRRRLSEGDYERLARKLGHSLILSIFAPFVLASGAAVGIIQDIVGAIRGVVEIVGNIRQLASQMINLIELMASDEGAK